MPQGAGDLRLACACSTFAHPWMCGLVKETVLGLETQKTKGSPLDNEAHPKHRTSGGRVALLWKQLGVTSHILAVRENGSKHLSAHLLGGERRPMFARSTPAPVISISENHLLTRRLPFFDLHAAQSTDAGWGRLWFCRFQVVGRLVLWDVVGGHNVCERGRRPSAAHSCSDVLGGLSSSKKSPDRDTMSAQSRAQHIAVVALEAEHVQTAVPACARPEASAAVQVLHKFLATPLWRTRNIRA